MLHRRRRRLLERTPSSLVGCVDAVWWHLLTRGLPRRLLERMPATALRCLGVSHRKGNGPRDRYVVGTCVTIDHFRHSAIQQLGRARAALPPCSNAHPIYTRFASITRSFSEVAMRPNSPPARRSLSQVTQHAAQSIARALAGGAKPFQVNHT